MQTKRETQTTKVNFGKTTPTARIQNTSESATMLAAHQMRIIIAHNGEITHANDAFAAHLGIPPRDLVGRRLLDSVLFENFDDLIDDRAIFNSLSHGERSSISSLREGEHILIMGRNRDHIPFYFSWVTGQDKNKYLVAHSMEHKAADPQTQPDWTQILGTLLPENDDKDMKPPQKPVTKTKIQGSKTTSKPAQSDVPAMPLTPDDIAYFARMNCDLMCLMQTDGTLIRANHALTKADKDHAGNFLSLIHSDDRAAVRQCLQTLTHNDPAADTAEFDARLTAQSGKPVWIQWHIRREGDHLYGLGHDITIVKDNEKALIAREQELHEAQTLARMGHWRWNVGSATIEWSDQIYAIFGVNREDFVPTLDNANNLLHKRDIGRMMQAFQRAIIEQNDYDMDFRVVRPDGSIRYVRCEGRCELDDDGDAIALYGIMQDITDQTEHEIELRLAKESAEQAYAAKSRFLANMSHELRTPLNAIIGFSDMIQRQMLGPLGSDKYVDYATSIKDSGEHLLDLITDILDMSKIEAGKYDLDLDKIQLGHVIQTAVRMIESRAQEGILTLDNQISSDGPTITADRRAVMQILLNILSNAVKFTEPGGKITIACEEFENHVSVKITDTGIGIPANKLQAVMRPFEQVSTAFTRNHEGSGLGLAITKELAELHGGTLVLESAVNQGTTATLRLPKEAGVRHSPKTV